MLERWPSGLRQRFAKPSYGLFCIGGSNPPLSAIRRRAERAKARCHDEAHSAKSDCLHIIFLDLFRENVLYFVYCIQSDIDPSPYYIGTTTDVSRRLIDHNTGKSIHTNKFRPWKILTYTAFEDKTKADKFEAYLKTGSGRAFAKRHF